MQYCYFLSQKLFKVLIIGSLIAFASITYAQEPEIQKFISRPIITEYTKEKLSLEFKFNNIGPENLSEIQYGLEIVKEKEGKTILVDAHGAGEVLSFASNEAEQLSVSYSVPQNLMGEHEVHLVVIDSQGNTLESVLIDTVNFTGSAPEIQILDDSCVFKDAEGNSFPLTYNMSTEVDTTLTITCVALNGLSEEVTLSQFTEVYQPSLLGKKEIQEVTTTHTLPASDVGQVSFSVATPSKNGIFALRLRLYNETSSSNDVVVQSIVNFGEKPNEAQDGHIATKTEEDTAIYIVSLLLSLLILLAILVYRRRTTLPTTTMHNPE